MPSASLETLTDDHQEQLGSQVALLDEARQAIQKATTVREVKEVKDRAEAIELYAKRAEYGEILAQKCVEIRLRAERKAGELLSESQKHKGGKPVTVDDGLEEPPTLEALGLTRNQSSKWQKIATIPESDFEIAVGSAKSEAELLRLARKLEAMEQEITAKPEPEPEPEADKWQEAAELDAVLPNSPFHPEANLRGCVCGEGIGLRAVAEGPQYEALYEITSAIFIAFQNGDHDAVKQNLAKFAGDE
jgi:hypothetical protein